MPPGPLPHGLAVPSGRAYLARNAPGIPDDSAEHLAAALNFPPITGATVVHVHTTGSGTRFVAGEQILDPARFYAAKIAALHLPPGQLLIIIGCSAAASASQLAGLHNGPVITAATDALSMPSRSALAGTISYTRGGLPVLTPGSWLLALPRRGRLIPLGPDILRAIGDGTLIRYLPRPLTISPLPGPAPRLRTPVRWSGTPPHAEPPPAGPADAE